MDQSPCSDEREKTSIDVECTHVPSKLAAAPSARGEYEGGSDGMTMDGITTSFSFCNDLVFLFLLHYVDGDGDGNGNGNGGK